MPDGDVGAEAAPEPLHALFDAFNRHDADAVMACMAEDCVFDAAAGPDANGTRYEGQDAVRAAFAEVWATFPDARHAIVGELAASTRRFVGTRADGARLEAEACDLFTVGGGKILTKSAFRKQRPLLAPSR